MTTSKGGRPVNPALRAQQMSEVARLRGTHGMTFRAIGGALGISDRQAQILWDEYWAAEHAIDQESAEKLRAGLASRLRLIRDHALALATNTRIKVTKDDPHGGSIELADFERVAKLGKLAVTCMVEEAKLFGLNKSVESGQNGSTLSLIEFLSAAEKTSMPSGLNRTPAA